MEDCDNKICRLCATECSNKCTNLFEEDDGFQNIYDIISKHFSINISPLKSTANIIICNECYSFLKRLEDFEKAVEEAQKFFEKYENQFNEIIETISIEFVPVTKSILHDSEENSQEIKIQDVSDSEEIHMEIIDNKKCNDTETVVPTTQLQKQITKQTNYSCSIKTSYICEVCAANCNSESQLKAHMKTIHKISNVRNIFSCTKCKKSFPTEKGYRSHAKNHAQVNMSCQLCGAIFSKKISLINHVKLVHTNERPFICEECGKGFKRSGDLNRHKEFHRDDTPFQCSVCEKRFKSKMVVKMHEKLHTDVKYDCTVCGLKLKTKHTLKGHMRTHSNAMEFQCSYCNKQFKHKKNLTCHLVTHTGLQPYSCIFCNQAFSLSWNCRTHQKNVHPKEYNQYTETGKSTIATTVVKQKFACGPKQRIDQYSINQLKEDPESDTAVL